MAGFPVDPSAVTSAWLSEVLGAQVRETRLERIAIGVGLLGRLYRAHLVGAPNLPPSVVLKFPTDDAQARSAVCEDLELYLSEVRFYQQIGATNPLPPARPYFAAFDEMTHDFVLVIEDLGGMRVADQIVGCQFADAETVVDAVARHHAHWWESGRFAALPWLKKFSTPSFSAGLVSNCEAAWPIFRERVGADLSPAMFAFGERFPTLIPWYAQELTRPPHTLLHGDLRLDQLFFAVEPDDPPVRVLDWQMTQKGRGAYDVAYFLSQSLDTETRRRCETALVARYRERLGEQGVDYPRDELWRDYRISTAWCFAYPVIAAGRIELANDRQLRLLREMVNRAATAIEDHDVVSLRPD